MGQGDFVYWPGGGGGGGGTGGFAEQIAGNTSGTTALISTGTLTLAGGNNVTLSQVGNAITISVPATASQTVQTQNIGGGTQQFFNPFSAAGVTRATVAGQSTLMFQPINVPYNFTATRANLFVSASVSTSSNSSHAGTLSYLLGIYTLNVSTLSLASSGSVSYVWTITSSNSSDSMSDMKMFSLPINVNATPGQYWFAHLSMTASANANWITFSNGIVNAAKVIGSFASGNTVQAAPGWGHYSAATAAMPASASLPGQVLGGAQIDVCPIFVNFMNFTG